MIVNLLDGIRSIPIEKTADLMNMLYELSESESIPPTEVPAYVKRRVEEKTKLDEEIQKAGAILEEKNVEIQTIEEYKKLKNELKKYSLSIENPRRFASILQTIDQIGYNPRKIVRELASIKSLRRTERHFKNNCKMWELRATQYKEILPLCEQIVSFGIGFHELAAFHAAVLKKTYVENLSYSEAAYALMNGIDISEKVDDKNKQLNDAIMKIQMVNLFSARHKDAINALMKLQFYGITEDQILKVCRFIEANGHNLNPASRQASC